MEKGLPPSLFVNDGSFMERFKQLQQGKGNEKDKDKGPATGEPKPVPVVSTTKPVIIKANSTNKVPKTSSGGKLAFSLKQKSKIVTPVKLGADEDEEESDGGNISDDAPAKRQRLGESDAFDKPSKGDAALPPPPSDPAVKNAADKLATFVAKNGRQFEHITRQKNPGDTPFKFLFDQSCSDYKYYEYRLAEEEKVLSQSNVSKASNSAGGSTSASKSAGGSHRGSLNRSSYQTPASALYEATEGACSKLGQTAPPAGADPIAVMEYYMKKAAEEEKKRPPKQSNDEMPPPASLQVGPPKKGHHMGDFIPPEELEKFMAGCNDAASQKAAKEAAERARIQADNVGHKLLSKMGWKEGEGLGSSRSGIADPIMAGGVKTNNLGVGAQQPGEVTPEDDIYEQYKKRMMLGYRYRPNPLNNPRKAYY